MVGTDEAGDGESRHALHLTVCIHIGMATMSSSMAAGGRRTRVGTAEVAVSTAGPVLEAL